LRWSSFRGAAGDGAVRPGQQRRRRHDGRAAAGRDAGLEVTTLLLGAPEGLWPDVVTAWGELLASAAPGTVHVMETAEELGATNEALKADLIVDAIVGTGFKPPLKGLALAALEWVKAASANSLLALTCLPVGQRMRRTPQR
jgi:NAD(P)H-hydrate repair Nnr-like enzyme with NAD(P)H-hydrate epimerase domain